MFRIAALAQYLALVSEACVIPQSCLMSSAGRRGRVQSRFSAVSTRRPYLAVPLEQQQQVGVPTLREEKGAAVISV